MIIRLLFLLSLTTALSHAQPDDFTCANLELLSAITTLSNPTQMEVRDGFAYIIEDQSSLAIVDITDPANLSILARTTTPLPSVDAITLNQNAAYLHRTDGQGFEIIDITDPLNPMHQNAFSLQIDDSPIVIDSQHLYANNRYIVDVTNPFNPVVMVNTPNIAEDRFIFALEGVAYTDQLYRYDLTDPLNPTEIIDYFYYNVHDRLKSSPPYVIGIEHAGLCSIFFPNYSMVGPKIQQSKLASSYSDIAIRDRIAFVAAEQLDVYLLSATARRIGSFNDQPGLDAPTQIEQIGDTTLILNTHGELATYNITTNPISATRTESWAQRLKLHGDNAFVLGDSDSPASSWFGVFDVSDPTNPTSIANTGLSIAWGFDLHQNYIYIATAPQGVSIVEFTNDLQLITLGNYDTNTNPDESNLASDIVIKDAIAYAVDINTGLHILDLSDPVNPSPIAIIPIAGSPRSLRIDDNLLFVSSPQEHLSIFDVSNPATPILLSQIQAQSDSPIGMQRPTRDANLLYTAEVWNGYRVFNIEDPANPIELVQIDTDITTINGDFTGLTYEITIEGDTLYAANSSGGLSIYDNTDPTNPILLRHIAGNFPQSGSQVTFRDIELHNNLAYIAAGDGGLRIYDLSNACDLPCPADLNSDGTLNFFDVSAFIVAFTNEEPLADFNNDGSFNFFDVSAFIVAFSNGCP